MALIIRDNFVASVPRLEAIIPYAAMCVVSAALVFTVTRLDRTIWRYISLPDILHLMACVTVALLLALLGEFILHRLDAVARSLPVIQWLLIIGGMVGSRIGVRLLGERGDRKRRHVRKSPHSVTNVLVVGLSDVTELYLCSIARFAPAGFVIAGILSPESQLRGRFMRKHKVLGTPEDIRQIIAQLDLHGITIDRVIITQPFEKLSKQAREALHEIERASIIKVEWLVESLGLRDRDVEDVNDAQDAPTVSELREMVPDHPEFLVGQYHRLKRVIDVTAATFITFFLAPVIMLAALLVAIDVGFPLVFWQQRPGRHGHPFKLFKFRTMRAAHDAEGNRIPDELRSSPIGKFLRRSWLDELPQLYNILVGEMSFVGPRPLLPIDQPKCHTSRLLVRPGLTGWAQINAGRDIAPEDKAVLDHWYIKNASLWLDLKILLRTLYRMIAGGQVDSVVAQGAHNGVEGIRTTMAVEKKPIPSTNVSLSNSGVPGTP
jgi:lipopolysaccharide/colanic/teichoic acid biosynthesis glycosyltransferase